MKLYLHYFLIHLKSCMQYKTSFFLTMIGQFLVSFNVFLGAWFMFDRFNTVKGFSFSECLLCFSLVLMSFTLAECFFRGFDGFSAMISNGQFDRILVRPRGLILQVLGQRIEFTRVGRFLQAVVMLVYGLANSGIAWNLPRILTVISMIFGGTVVFASLFILYAGFCFFTIEGLEFMNIFTDGAREYGKYPIGIYGKGVLRFCTYVIPFALFQYYPFLYLIGQREEPWWGLLPLVACVFVVPCLLFWRFGVSRYRSTGS